MKILTRYVVFDLLKVFLLILTGLTFVIFIGLMGREAVDMGVGLGPLLRMTPYFLPDALQYSVPGTMLLAATYVYGRMSSYNEIVAIKSLGISPMVLVWPTLMVATLVSFAGVAINDLAVSWGRQGINRVGLESIEQIIYGQLGTRHTLTVGRWTISVRQVDGHRLCKVIAVEQPSGNKRGRLVVAEEAEVHSDPVRATLTLIVNKYEVEGEISGMDLTKPLEFPIPLEGFAGATSRLRSPSNLALREIQPAVAESRVRREQIEQSMTAQTSFAMLTGDFDAISEASWKQHEREINAVTERLHRLHTEPWRRWANGFSCLCFVLVGAPMAIRLRHAEFLAIFFVCFLPILIVYYPMLIVSVKQAKDGVVPPPAVWLGNIVLALWGAWLLRRVIRY